MFVKVIDFGIDVKYRSYIYSSQLVYLVAHSELNAQMARISIGRSSPGNWDHKKCAMQ